MGEVRLDAAIERRTARDAEQQAALERWWAALSEEERAVELRKHANAGHKLRFLQMVAGMMGTASCTSGSRIYGPPRDRRPPARDLSGLAGLSLSAGGCELLWEEKKP
jgi:hypothetical protein